MSQAVLYAKVLAVSCRILPDEVDLSNAGGEQASRLVDHGLRTAATVGTAILRNHAKRTGVVTTLTDLDVGKVTRRGQNARREVVVEVRLTLLRAERCAFADRDDAIELVGA